MEKKLDEVKKKVLSALSLDNLPPGVKSSGNVALNVMKNKIYIPSKKLMRKVVTGDEKKRVRDLIREKKQKPQYIKLFDKISFTFFTLNLPICQYFLLNRPEYFWLWFSFIIPILLIARYFYFHSLKMEYFLYDFCYFSNFLSLLTIYYTPSWLFRMVFIFVNGPVTLAILVWRLSLVFHDFDRVTSIYIHLLPASLFFVFRWQIIPPEQIEPLTIWDFLHACAGYIFWQVAYYLKTEVFDREKLDNNPELKTSLRWLAADKKNATARSVLKLLRFLHIMGPEEDYVSTEFKTKLIFMISQFFYTILTFIPSFFVYYSYHLHLAYILLVFTNSVYNGASFYIEVFSQRYQLQFAKKEDMQQVVQAAAEIAIKAAAAAAAENSSSESVKSSTDGEFLHESDAQATEQAPESPHPPSPMKNKVILNEEPLSEETEEDRTLRRNESIRVAIEEATTAFVDVWTADDDHSCNASDGRLSDLDGSNHERTSSIDETPSSEHAEENLNGSQKSDKETDECTPSPLTDPTPSQSPASSLIESNNDSERT